MSIIVRNTWIQRQFSDFQFSGQKGLMTRQCTSSPKVSSRSGDDHFCPAQPLGLEDTRLCVPNFNAPGSTTTAYKSATTPVYARNMSVSSKPRHRHHRTSCEMGRWECAHAHAHAHTHALAQTHARPIHVTRQSGWPRENGGGDSITS